MAGTVPTIEDTWVRDDLPTGDGGVERVGV